MGSKLVSVIAVVVVAFLLATNPVVAHAARQVTGHQIKNGSVTGKDLKDHSVKAADLADGSVTGAAVSDHSLTGADIDTGSLPVVHHVVVRQVNGPANQTVAAGGTLTVNAPCQPGEVIVGGGAYSSNPRLAITQTWPDTTNNRWIVVISNLTADPIPGQVISFASCAS